MNKKLILFSVMFMVSAAKVSAASTDLTKFCPQVNGQNTNVPLFLFGDPTQDNTPLNALASGKVNVSVQSGITTKGTINLFTSFNRPDFDTAEQNLNAFVASYAVKDSKGKLICVPSDISYNVSPPIPSFPYGSSSGFLFSAKSDSNSNDEQLSVYAASTLEALNDNYNKFSKMHYKQITIGQNTPNSEKSLKISYDVPPDDISGVSNDFVSHLTVGHDVLDPSNGGWQQDNLVSQTCTDSTCTFIITDAKSEPYNDADSDQYQFTIDSGARPAEWIEHSKSCSNGCFVIPDFLVSAQNGSVTTPLFGEGKDFPAYNSFNISFTNKASFRPAVVGIPAKDNNAVSVMVPSGIYLSENGTNVNFGTFEAANPPVFNNNVETGPYTLHIPNPSPVVKVATVNGDVDYSLQQQLQKSASYYAFPGCDGKNSLCYSSSTRTSGEPILKAADITFKAEGSQPSSLDIVPGISGSSSSYKAVNYTAPQSEKININFDRVKAQPGLIFAPYLDANMMKVGDDSSSSTLGMSMGEALAEHHIQYLTMAFVQGTGTVCDKQTDACYKFVLTDHDNPPPSWLKLFVKNGGKFILSFGGANGPYLTDKISAHEKYLEQVEKVVDAVNAAYPTDSADNGAVAGLDWDIEDSRRVLTSGSEHSKVLNLINGAVLSMSNSQDYKTLLYSYTLAVPSSGIIKQASGDTSAGDYDILRDLYAKASSGGKTGWLKSNFTVNLMAMDFGDSDCKPVQGGAVNLEACIVSSLSSSEDSLSSLGYKRFGVTPMIGQNDISSEVFKMSDAADLRNAIILNNENASNYVVTRLSFWSLDRDFGNLGIDFNSAGLPASSMQNQPDFFYSDQLNFGVVSNCPASGSGKLKIVPAEIGSDSSSTSGEYTYMVSDIDSSNHIRVSPVPPVGAYMLSASVLIDKAGNEQTFYIPNTPFLYGIVSGGSPGPSPSPSVIHFSFAGDHGDAVDFDDKVDNASTEKDIAVSSKREGEQFTITPPGPFQHDGKRCTFSGFETQSGSPMANSITLTKDENVTLKAKFTCSK